MRELEANRSNSQANVKSKGKIQTGQYQPEEDEQGLTETTCLSETVTSEKGQLLKLPQEKAFQREVSEAKARP